MKIKRIDDTAGRLGFAMRNARHTCHLPADEAAMLLHITPAELFEYERCSTAIPTDVLEHAFIMGYKMMRVRRLETQYRRQRNMFNRLKQLLTNTPK